MMENVFFQREDDAFSKRGGGMSQWSQRTSWEGRRKSKMSKMSIKYSFLKKTGVDVKLGGSAKVQNVQDINVDKVSLEVIASS